MRQTDFASKTQNSRVEKQSKILSFNFEEKSREIMLRKKTCRVLQVETKPTFKDYTYLHELTYVLTHKEVCNGGVACSLLKLDGG